MAYDVLDVANYIVNRSIDINKPVSNLKLQKLLYYVQAAFLVSKKEPAFENVIYAWKYGPVVKEAYDSFKDFVDRDIEEKITFKFEGVFGDKLNTNYDPSKIICINDRLIIRKVIDSYKDYNPMQMVYKSHKESPWIEAYDEGYWHTEISNEDIKCYFINNMREVYGAR